jgi:hypothetical protein
LYNEIKNASKSSSERKKNDQNREKDFRSVVNNSINLRNSYINNESQNKIIDIEIYKDMQYQNS